MPTRHHDRSSPRPTPTSPQFAYWLSRMPVAARVNEADDIVPAPFARSGTYGVLSHKLISVVVVAVVYAVDVA